MTEKNLEILVNGEPVRPNVFLNHISRPYEGFNYYSIAIGNRPKKNGIHYAILRRWPDCKIKRRKILKKEIPLEELKSFPQYQELINRAKQYGSNNRPSVVADTNLSQIVPLSHEFIKKVEHAYERVIVQLNQYFGGQNDRTKK